MRPTVNANAGDYATGMMTIAHGLLLEFGVRGPLNNSLRTQRGLERAAVVSCLDGKGGSLS